MSLSPSSLDDHDASSVAKNLSTNGSSAVDMRGPPDSTGLSPKASYSNKARFFLFYLRLQETSNLTVIFYVSNQTDNGSIYRVVLQLDLFCLLMQMHKLQEQRQLLVAV